MIEFIHRSMKLRIAALKVYLKKKISTVTDNEKSTLFFFSGCVAKKDNIIIEMRFQRPTL